MNQLSIAALFLLSLCCLAAPGLIAQDAERSPDAVSGVREIADRLRTKVGGSAALTWTTTQPRTNNANPALTNRRANAEEGFMGEFALFATIDPTPKVRGHFRVCYGCHQLEVESAHFSLEIAEHLSLRAGRFALPLGGINTRHDQSVRVAVSKPLVQGMGNMVRGREFNQGVIPAPMVDNGVAVSGSFDVGGWKVSSELFIVNGPKGFGPDIDFITSRSYSDNNSEPSAGGRIQITGDWLSLGGSGMAGNYNRDGNRFYHIATVDLGLEFGALKFDILYAQRRTEYTDSFGVQSAFWKRGYWAQASYRVQDGFSVYVMGDGLFISDMELGSFGPTTFVGSGITDRSNQVHRVSGGFSWSPYTGVIVKAGAEYYDFSDFKDAVAAQFGLVWSF